MIAKRLRESLDSSICIRDIFEEGKKLASIYGAENIFNFTIGNPSVEPPAIVNETIKEILDTENPLALHGYPANVGHPEVREHVAGRLNEKYGCSYEMNGIIMTLMYELRRIGGGVGIACLCGGLAQGDGVLIEVPK